MLDSLPTPGLWLVTEKPNVKSAEHIMKISEVPEQWPLIHYAGYRDVLNKELSKFLESHECWAVNDVINVVLRTISKEHVKQSAEEFPDKIIKTIEDLI